MTESVKHLNSTTFQSRFFSDLLESAKSRARKGLKPQNGTSDEEGENGNNVDPSSTSDSSDDTGELRNAADSDSHSQVEDGNRQAEASEEPPTEAEVDDDDSRFSDQDIEDFDQPRDDSYWSMNDVERERERYELSGWYYHVREAESRWSVGERKDSEEWQLLLQELERFFLLEPVAFEIWKLAYVGTWQEDWEPLLFAAMYGLTSLAELLLDRGAKVMDLSPGGDSALHTSALAPNQFEMLQLLLDRGGDPNFEGLTMPAFHTWLTFDVNVNCVQQFLCRDASCSLIDRENEWNALHYFAGSGSDREVLDLLLDNPWNVENRADINVRDGEGETPLHKLLRRQPIPIDLLEGFLSRGADVNIEDRASERPLYEAASWGDLAAVKTIIDHVTDVNDANCWGRTALHGAAWAGQKEIVEFLLDHGADVGRTDNHNRTPLLFACLSHIATFSQVGDHQATAELLVEKQIESGASFGEINVCTKRGRTPLREAAGRGFTQVVTNILERMTPETQAWINQRDGRKGRAPLHSAATHGRGELITLLIKHGADPTLRDGENGTGMTSLELCVDRWARIGHQRYENAVELLFDFCVDEAKENQLLLMTAAIHGSVLVLEKLANIGVNLDQPDGYGWTPSQLASQFGHAKAANFIRKSLASRALRPTRWIVGKGSRMAILQEDGLRVHLPDGTEHFCIVADHPVPAGLTLYYFEIEILDPETGESHGKLSISIFLCAAAVLFLIS